MSTSPRNPDEPPMSVGTEVRHLVDREHLEIAQKRIGDLSGELKALELSNRQLQAGFETSQARLERADKNLRRAELLVRAMERGFDQLRRSSSMQVGYTVLEALRSWRGLVRAPLRLLAVLRQGRRQDLERTEAVVEVPVPQDWFPIGLRKELQDYQARHALPDETLARRKGGEEPRSRTGSNDTPEQVSDLRIASIMDEFTFAAFSESCHVRQVHPETFAAEIEALKPHFLFIESAWHGHENSWERQVSNASKSLRDLVKHCRVRGIPVAFWSKEDPVHFKTFLKTAALADVVFTTDIDCVKHYKRELGHDRVYLLPFATEQRTHNPIEKYRRIDRFCFAGSYYLRYPVRQRDFDALVEAAESLGGVDIYDRNHGKEHPNYRFPEKYRDRILGGLSFDQIDIAYKGYEYGININTVKGSQSMFARRVFDLAASGTITISNYSRGLRALFGDLVVSSDNPVEIVRRIRPLRDDPVLKRRYRLAGIRKVMREHTYDHRLQYVARKVAGMEPVLGRVGIAMVALVRSEASLAKAIEDFRRQDYHARELVLVVAEGFVPRVSPAGPDVQVLAQHEAGRRRVATALDKRFVGVFHHDDHYGPGYLGDLADAAGYSTEAAVGKSTSLVMLDGAVQEENPGTQYQLGCKLRIRSGICRASELEAYSILDLVLDAEHGAFPVSGLSVDEFSYCRSGAGHPAAVERARADLDIDAGIPIDALLERAEAIGLDGTPAATLNASAGLAGLSGAEIAEAIGTPANKYLAVSMQDGACLVSSTLPVGKHAYVYLQGRHSPSAIGITDIVRMQLVVEQGASGVELVLVYDDAGGNKISHHILKSGMNVTATVPAGVDTVRIGLRVSRPGDILVRRLTFDHVPLAIDELLTSGRYLVLAKNYPSYDDLYKHAFVHRRVVEYKRQGLDVDVYRIGNEGLEFYEFEGVDVIHGGASHLRAALEGGNHDAILVHFLDERMWEVLKDFVDHKRIYVWAHGAEIQSASRREFDQHDEAGRDRAKRLGDRRMRFWRGVLEHQHPNLKMVFVSEWFARDVMADVGVEIREGAYHVIHNFIDCELFAYSVKDPALRSRFLSIRPYESAKYANDLAVEAVLRLRDEPDFGDMHFRFVGDGSLFDATLAPLRGLDNVVIERRFLTQAEIAQLHSGYGIFVSPTRMDAQGVSRDEAMASGLVPLTNRVTAIPEFVDDTCGLLAGADDAAGMAAAMLAVHRDPALFERLSRAAASRVRAQSGLAQTIEREIELFTSVYPGCGG